MADVKREELSAMEATLNGFFSSKMAKELQKVGSVVEVELADGKTIDVNFTEKVVRIKGVRTFFKGAPVQYRSKISSFLGRMAVLSQNGYKKASPIQWRSRRAKKELKAVAFK